MKSLREAIEEGELERFIAGHKSEVGDANAFNTIIRSMAGTLKEAPEASSPDDCDD